MAFAAIFSVKWSQGFKSYSMFCINFVISSSSAGFVYCATLSRSNSLILPLQVISVGANIYTMCGGIPFLSSSPRLVLLLNVLST